jgi:hypothetical protein
MARYTNSYLEADIMLHREHDLSLYEFLVIQYKKGMTHAQVVLNLHDLGFDTSDETIRNWYRLLLRDLPIGQVA